MCTDVVVTGMFSLAGVALGCIIGGIIAYVSALRTNRIFAIREAANNLRAAFAQQLSAIWLNQDASAVDIQRILEPSINTLTVEMVKFRSYISRENLSAYDEACEKFQSIARIRAMNYEAFGGKKPFKVFEKIVNDILQFTKL